MSYKYELMITVLWIVPVILNIFIARAFRDRRSPVTFKELILVLCPVINLLLLLIILLAFFFLGPFRSREWKRSH